MSKFGLSTVRNTTTKLWPPCFSGVTSKLLEDRWNRVFRFYGAFGTKVMQQHT